MSTTRLLSIPALMFLYLGIAWAQGEPTGGSSQGMSPASSAYSPANSAAAGANNAQNILFGGIPSGKATDTVLPLSLSEALKRGLNYNLGAVLSEQSVTAARSNRLLSLSRLLPTVATHFSESQQQVNLAAYGFEPTPGMNMIVGPFNVFDVRASVNQTVLDFGALHRYRAASESLKAAQFSHENARELVVYVCANLYLQAVAGSSRIEATRAQVNTAQTLYNLAVDQKAAGVSPGIEVLRAQVELQAQQQRLIVAEDQFAKDKLALARAIGLPLGQEFILTDGMSFAPIQTQSLIETVERAYKERPDYQSAIARVHVAELERKAAKSGHLPTIGFSADYGDIGQKPWESHGTFSVSTSVRFPLFQGGSVRARVMEADVLLRQRQSELEDLKGRIYYDVQNAFLDLKAAADRVQVAQSAIKLAEEQVRQSQDRFSAGVTNNVEVVQAQEALATASENYISSLQAHSAAKLALAKAMGISETAYEQFLRGQ
jgi:outer membrane protein TolC